MANDKNDWVEVKAKPGSDDWTAVNDWKEEPRASALESTLRGAAQGVSLGFADELAGLAGLVNGKGYSKERDESRALYDAAQKANPKSYMGGELGGGVLSTFLAPGLGVAKGAGLGTVALKSALQGAIAGAGSSKADISKGDMTGLATDIVSSGAIGGALGSLGHGIGSAPSALAKRIKDFSEFRAASALGATKAALSRQGAEAIKETGRKAMDKGIISLLGSTEGMLDKSAALKKSGGEMMGSAYKGLDAHGPAEFLPSIVAGEVETGIGKFPKLDINKGKQTTLENISNSIRGMGENPVPLTEAQLVKQELGKAAYPKFGKSNPDTITQNQEMLQNAYTIYNKALDDAAEKAAARVGDPELASKLIRGKEDFGTGASAEKLLLDKLNKEQGNKFLGMTDWLGAAAATQAAGPGGLAAIPVKKLLENYGNSALALGSNKLIKPITKTSKILDLSPDVLRRMGQSGAIQNYFKESNE